MPSVLLCAALLTCAKPLSRPPHIVLAVVDDLGWNGLRFAARANGEVVAPFTDALARDGVVLDNYRVFKFCAPSRAALLTGRAPGHGVSTANPAINWRSGVNRAMRMLPAMLRRAGYATAAVGKWHQGFHHASFTPRARGFDSFFGFLGGAEDHFTQCAGCGNALDVSFAERARACPAHRSPCGVECPTQGDVDLFRDDRPAFGENGTYSTLALTAEACRVIRRHAAAPPPKAAHRPPPPSPSPPPAAPCAAPPPPPPLFLYLALQAVHLSLEAPAQFTAHYARGAYPGPAAARRVYNAMHTAADEALRNVSAELRAAGMWANTVLVLTTDNGGTFEHGAPVPGSSNFPLRGHKYSYFDGGVRGTALVASPLLPRAARGTRCAAPLHIADWYPTLLGLGGASADDGYGAARVDGVDAWPMLLAGCRAPHGQRPASAWAHAGGPRAGEVVLGLEYGQYGHHHPSLLPASAWRASSPLLSSASSAPASSAQRPRPLVGGALLVNGSLKLILGAQPRQADGWSARYPGSTPVVPAPREPSCARAPCLFDLAADPRETTDLFGDGSGARARALRARLDELGRMMDSPDPDAGEPPSAAAGTDGHGDAASLACRTMRTTGFWQPWDPSELGTATRSRESK